MESDYSRQYIYIYVIIYMYVYITQDNVYIHPKYTSTLYNYHKGKHVKTSVKTSS